MPMSIIAKAKTSTIELLIMEDHGNGSSTPLLQKFPTTAPPRIGEGIGIGDGEYTVTKVTHLFNVSEENRHTIMAEVRRTK
jgi:hypothetical protein